MKTHSPVYISDIPTMHLKNSLEEYFSEFRANIIGQGQMFESAFGYMKIIYADWTATGRAYGPIEGIHTGKDITLSG